MATFEKSSGNEVKPLEYKKYSLRRLEPAIQKFLKVIQIDLARLHRHQLNVEKYNRLQDWGSLHTEQVNATRTIQQIKANLGEIEKSRCQVEEKDLQAFDDKIGNMKHGAIKAVKEFFDLAHGQSTPSSADSSPDSEDQPLTFQDQAQLNELPENTQVAESWEYLQENLEELNLLIHQFANTVQTQQESIDRIEDNIEQAHTDVQEGTKQLGKASVFKAAVFPVAGALLGTVVAGPVGLIAGAKIGGVLGAVGGGAAGYFSGRFWKKRQEKVTNIELAKLSRANSEPSVHSDSNSEESLFGWGRRRNLSEAEFK